jgi:hypothetical protein
VHAALLVDHLEVGLDPVERLAELAVQRVGHRRHPAHPDLAVGDAGLVHGDDLVAAVAVAFGLAVGWRRLVVAIISRGLGVAACRRHEAQAHDGDGGGRPWVLSSQQRSPSQVGSQVCSPA